MNSQSTMTIYDDYIEYDQQAKSKYGSKSVVLIQVGSFFEMYAVINSTEISGADIHYIADICDFVVSKKNKSVPEVSRANPLMAGFPEHALQKFLPVLIDNGFTVVVVRQVTPPPNSKRAITDVLSAATRQDVSGTDNNFLLCLFLEHYSQSQNAIAGAAALTDVSTGQTILMDISPTRSITSDIKKLLFSHSPKEAVIMCAPTRMEEVVSTLKQHIPVVHDSWQCSPNIRKPAFQEALFHEVFPDHGTMLSAIEFLHLERHDAARTALALMIGFLQQHSEALVYRLRPPQFETISNTLSMELNSLVQLNIISKSTVDNKRSLLTTLQAACSTPQGARLFKTRLLNPSCDPGEIQRHYKQIRDLLSTHKYIQVKDTLSGTGDFERWIRKIALRSLPPMELPNVQSAIMAYLRVAGSLDDDALATSSTRLLDALKCINLEEAAKYHQEIKTNIFQEGHDAALDEMQSKLDAAWARLKEIQSTITDLGKDDNTSTCAKLDFNERDGYYITITKKRLQTAKALLAKAAVPHKLWTHESPVSQSSQVMKLLGGEIKGVSDDIILTQGKISSYCQNIYKDFLEQVYVTYNTDMFIILNKIACTDVYVACAHNAATLGHTEPCITPLGSLSQCPYFTAKGLRHPIIESLGVTYHPNDVSLGGNTSATTSGMLLYGINASGKSCLMKSVGIAVIMAQAGMYVPCASFQFFPYTKLFTRISTGDDIYQGHSTFMVEMLEFRHILKNADNMSLVLGDEIAAGTETQSALAIVAAGVNQLAKRNASFIFTTHLHDLLDISAIKTLTNISVQHLHAYVDNESGEIIYDRTLRPGNGETNYGLLVCEALKMPLEFIRTAQLVQQECGAQTPSWVNSWRPSRYNSQVILSKCSMCGDPATEAHHVTPQAALKGAPNHVKNARDNLMPLCTKCHDDMHASAPTKSTQPHPQPDVVSIRNYLRLGNKGWMCRTTGKGRWGALTTAKFSRVSKCLGDITMEQIEAMEQDLRDVSL